MSVIVERVQIEDLCPALSSSVSGLDNTGADFGHDFNGRIFIS